MVRIFLMVPFLFAASAAFAADTSSLPKASDFEIVQPPSDGVMPPPPVAQPKPTGSVPHKSELPPTIFPGSPKGETE